MQFALPGRPCDRRGCSPPPASDDAASTHPFGDLAVAFDADPPRPDVAPELVEPWPTRAGLLTSLVAVRAPPPHLPTMESSSARGASRRFRYRLDPCGRGRDTLFRFRKRARASETPFVVIASRGIKFRRPSTATQPVWPRPALPCPFRARSRRVRVNGASLYFALDRVAADVSPHRRARPGTRATDVCNPRCVFQRARTHVLFCYQRRVGLPRADWWAGGFTTGGSRRRAPRIDRIDVVFRPVIETAVPPALRRCPAVRASLSLRAARRGVLDRFLRDPREEAPASATRSAFHRRAPFSGVHESAGFAAGVSLSIGFARCVGAAPG